MSQNLDKTFSDLVIDDDDDDSDDDENDVYYEVPLQRFTQKLTSNVSSAKSKKSWGSDSLFGITEEALEVDMSLGKPAANSTLVNPNDDDGVATDDDDLGFDPKKPKAATSKSTLFDDILGSTQIDSRRSAGLNSMPTPASRRSANYDDRRPAISRQSTDTTTENSVPQRPKTSSGRRGSSMSNVMNSDPLGLFNQPAQSTKEQPQQERQQMKKRSTTADWLGLNAAETDDELATPGAPNFMETPRAASAKDSQESKSQSGYDTLKLNETVDPKETINKKNVSDDAQNTVSQVAPVATSTAQSLMKLNAVNWETRNAFAMLQQQEPQLNLATQMKQQERVFLEMQRRQEALLQQQEQQFQSLLQQQMQRQQNLEDSIRQQQQRINAHIQLMLTQPVFPLEGYVLPSNDEHQATTHAATRSAGSETYTAGLEPVQGEKDLRQLEMETQRLEELIANIKANYESEIQMIEATYKKQLGVLDEHTSSMESRFRAEIAALTDHFREKLTSLEQEHQRKKEKWEAEMSSLRQDHEDELRRIRKTHEENLEMVRLEHKRVLESVQSSKLHEFAIVQDNNNYLDVLKAASANLTEASTGLQDLREHLQAKLELLNMEKQNELDTRERQIANKESQLQLLQKTTEQEKEHLMKLVATLQQQLNSLSKESNEENWQLRMKLSALEADKTAFEHEKEYLRDQMQRDEKRLAELKDRQMADIQRIELELQEERRQLHVERVKFETQQKLRLSGDTLERDRCEMETAIKCAQNATRQADAERQRYTSLQYELEQRKRELIDGENDIRQRKEKLNDEMKICNSARQQAHDAIQRARQAEQNYFDKLQTLQKRSRELAEKESFLAEERKLLAQQRIAIKAEQIKIRNRLEDASGAGGGGADDGAVNEGGEYERLERVKQKLQATEDAHKKRKDKRPPLDVVDQLLDDKIAESMLRMRDFGAPPNLTSLLSDSTKSRYGLSSTGDDWSPMGLDDDAKSFVLNSNLETLYC